MAAAPAVDAVAGTGALYDWAGMLLFSLAAVLAAGLALRTVQGVPKQEFRRPEH